MKLSSSTRLRLTIAGLIILAMAAMVPAGAFALTPAGTTIGNSATATYKDEVNNDFTTTSNTVTTVVLAVCGVDVLADDPQADNDPSNGAAVEVTGVPGQTVNVPFSVKNTGNAEYTWSLSTAGGTYTKAIYLDSNGNGIVDAGETTVASVTIAMGATKYVVVQVAVPSGAASGATDGFTLTATNGGCDDTTTGRVTVSADANFTANKAVDNGSPSPGGTLTYTVTFKNNGLKPAKGRDGYSVDLDNNGSIAGAEIAGVEGILVRDQVPAGATFTSGVNTASGSPAVSPTGYVVYSADGTDWYKAAASVPGSITYVGYFLQDSAPTDDTLQDVFAVDQQGTFTFTAAVDSPFTEPDGCVDNTASVLFAKSTGANASTTTNTVSSCVNAANAANIAIGGINGYSWNGGTGHWETANGAAAWEEDGTYTDDNYAENVSAGTWVSFPHQARNRSAFTDTVTLSYDAANSSIPAGAVVEFWNSDGSAKLVGNSLGSVTGTTNIDFTVKVYLPINAATKALDGTPDWYVTVKAASGNNAAEVDRSRDNIDGVVPAGVDIAAQTLGGDGQSAAADGGITTPADATNDDISPAVAANPGATAAFPFEVVNTGGSSDSYDLSETSGNAPSGSTVKFYEDLSCSGTAGAEITNTGLIGGARVVADAGNTATTFKVNNVANFSGGDSVIVGLDGVKMTVASVDSAAKTITLTAALAGVPSGGTEVSETKCYVMLVTTLANTPAGDSALAIDATSPSSGTTDDIDALLTVNEVCSIGLMDNSNDQLPAGGSTTYTHTVTNNGNASVDVDVTVTGASVLTYTFVADTDGDLTDETYAGATGFTKTLAAGAAFTFKLNVQAPSGTAAGTTETVVVNAATVDAGGCSDTVNDKTDVIEGFLQLTKEVDIATGSPHDNITYKITYKNIGTQDAKGVVVTDTIPNDTVFIKAGIGQDGPANPVASAEGQFGLETTGDWTADTVYTTADDADQAEWDSANNLVRFRVGTGADGTNGGTVAAGESGTIIFQVIIK